MRSTVLTAVLAAGVLAWGLAGSSAAAVKSPEELQKDQQIKSGQGAQPYDKAKDQATGDQAGGQAATGAGAAGQSGAGDQKVSGQPAEGQPAVKTGGAGAASSPSTQTGAAAAASPESQSGAQTGSSPSSTSGAQTAASPGASGTSQISDADLRKHAEAHMALQQKAPDLVKQLSRVKGDPSQAFMAADTKKLEQAIQGTGLSSQEFFRVHKALVSDPSVRSRFKQQMAQLSGQQPAATSGTSTSGAQSSKSPDSSGAEKSGAQPSASPR